MALALPLRLWIVTKLVVILGRLIGFAGLLDSAEAVDGFEAALRVTEANGLREGSVALESCHVSTGRD